MASGGAGPGLGWRQGHVRAYEFLGLGFFIWGLGIVQSLGIGSYMMLALVWTLDGDRALNRECIL